MSLGTAIQDFPSGAPRMAAATSRLCRGHVLIVEDDPLCLQVMENTLERQGLQVTTARDGLEALRIVDAVTPDLILVDYVMPRMDGLELARRLRENRATQLIPIIMVTGVLGADMGIRALDAGVNDFLNKPANPAELLARVRAHLRNKFLVDRLEDMENIILAMSKAVDAKDPYTNGHSERVAQMAVRIGERLGLIEDDLRSLRLGGLLHDVGKIGVPDDILRKPSELGEDERSSLARHSVVGEEILRSIRSLGGLLHVVRHHHEKLDGSGYPDGLKSGQISLLTRIITVCDIYDSLTTRRPYREPLGPMEARAALREQATRGKIDGKVVECLALAAGNSISDERH